MYDNNGGESDDVKLQASGEDGIACTGEKISLKNQTKKETI